MEATVLSRREFLKRLGCGALGITALLKFGTVPALAANVSDNSKNDSGIIKSNVAPSDHSKMWVNTGSGANAYGISGRSVPEGTMCYWDEANHGWRPTVATWA